MPYPESYGPPHRAAKPDFTRCCAALYPDGWGSVQCSRRKVVGDYCRTHDPEAVAARDRAKERRIELEYNKRRLAWQSVEAIRQIAAGHNDPMTLARSILAEFEGTDK